jgi:hypothetical protein
MCPEMRILSRKWAPQPTVSELARRRRRMLVKRDAGMGQAIEGPLPLALDGHAFVFKAF